MTEPSGFHRLTVNGCDCGDPNCQKWRPDYVGPDDAPPSDQAGTETEPPETNHHRLYRERYARQQQPASAVRAGQVQMQVVRQEPGSVALGRVAELEREHRLLLSHLIGSAVVCSYSVCTRRALNGTVLPTPHVYLPGECHPKDDQQESGELGKCFHCGTTARVWWSTLPAGWYRRSGDGVTWQAGWLCMPCRRTGGEMIVFDALAPTEESTLTTITGESWPLKRDLAILVARLRQILLDGPANAGAVLDLVLTADLPRMETYLTTETMDEIIQLENARRAQGAGNNDPKE